MEFDEYDEISENLKDLGLSVSEAARTGIKTVIDQQADQGVKISVDNSEVLHQLAENREVLISEIQQNRVMIVMLQKQMEDKRDLSGIKNDVITDQIVKYWKSNLHQVRAFNRIVELEEFVEFDFQKDYARNALMKFIDLEFVKIVKGDKLRWLE